jgi:hypothetical protein
MLRSLAVIQGSKKPRLPSRETVLYGILTLVVALGVLQISALLGLTLFRQLEMNANIGAEKNRVAKLQAEVKDLKTRFEQAKKTERVIIPKTPTVILKPVKPK